MISNAPKNVSSRLFWYSYFIVLHRNLKEYVYKLKQSTPIIIPNIPRFTFVHAMRNQALIA
jgi:hypothetical protein